MHFMTKNADNFLIKQISKTSKDNKVWDLTSFYNLCLSDGYKKSKRSFDREIAELGFYPKLTFDENNHLLKKLYLMLGKKFVSRKGCFH